MTLLYLAHGLLFIGVCGILAAAAITFYELSPAAGPAKRRAIRHRQSLRGRGAAITITAIGQ